MLIIKTHTQKQNSHYMIKCSIYRISLSILGLILKIVFKNFATFTTKGLFPCQHISKRSASDLPGNCSNIGHNILALALLQKLQYRNTVYVLQTQQLQQHMDVIFGLGICLESVFPATSRA